MNNALKKAHAARNVMYWKILSGEKERFKKVEIIKHGSPVRVADAAML